MSGVCERCGSTNDLQVHHRDRNRRNNRPENRETLCRPCHVREHGEAGPSADYFWRAPAGDLARWKAAAHDVRLPFSQWLRDAAESYWKMTVEQPVDARPVEAAPVVDAGVASTGAAVVQTPPAALVERAESMAAARGREVRPDPRVK